jgi:hypothetical protein
MCGENRAPVYARIILKSGFTVRNVSVPGRYIVCVSFDKRSSGDWFSDVRLNLEYKTVGSPGGPTTTSRYVVLTRACMTAF